MLNLCKIFKYQNKLMPRAATSVCKYYTRRRFYRGDFFIFMTFINYEIFPEFILEF